jgi:hypothetical protein
MADTPTDPTPAPLPGWYAALPRAGQVLLQLGFAGLFACVFLWQQWTNNNQAAEERRLLWEEIRGGQKELQAQRDEAKAQREEMRAMRHELHRAVDAMNAGLEEFKRRAPAGAKEPPGDGCPPEPIPEARP